MQQQRSVEQKHDVVELMLGYYDSHEHYHGLQAHCCYCYERGHQNATRVVVVVAMMPKGQNPTNHDVTALLLLACCCASDYHCDVVVDDDDSINVDSVVVVKEMIVRIEQSGLIADLTETSVPQNQAMLVQTTMIVLLKVM